MGQRTIASYNRSWSEVLRYCRVQTTHAARGPCPRGNSGQENAEGKEDTGEGPMSFIQMKACPNNGGNLRGLMAEDSDSLLTSGVKGLYPIQICGTLK